jgi:hypothetical protein
MSAQIEAVNDGNFEVTVLESKQPVLVDFLGAVVRTVSCTWAYHGVGGQGLFRDRPGRQTERR